MKLTDGDAIRLRSIIRGLPDADATWLYAFASRHTEPCRR